MNTVELFETKLIARFLYGDFYYDCGDYSFILKDTDVYKTDINYLDYNCWEELIPVIKKCIENNIYASDWGNHLHDGLLFSNLEKCYESVVEFLKNLDND